MSSRTNSFRMTPEDEQRLNSIASKLGLHTRTDVLRTAIHVLEEELNKGQERVAGLISRLDEFIPAFDPGVVDDSGFDMRRDRAWVRVGDVTYTDAPTTIIFAERMLEDGRLEKTKVERGGENPAKRMWIGPARIEA